MRHVLNQTPPERLCDRQGRPYFSWDSDLTLTQWRQGLSGSNAAWRALLVARLMRQARPDDVLLFVRPQDVIRDWALVEPHLGRERPYWTWLVNHWRRRHDWQQGADSDAA